MRRILGEPGLDASCHLVSCLPGRQIARQGTNSSEFASIKEVPRFASQSWGMGRSVSQTLWTLTKQNGPRKLRTQNSVLKYLLWVRWDGGACDLHETSRPQI